MPEKEFLAVRDNTLTPGMYNNSQIEFNKKNQEHLKDYISNTRYDDGPLGYMPYIGNALQGMQAVKEFDDGKYLEAGIDAGLILMPNLLEKPIKKFIFNPIRRTSTYRNFMEQFIKPTITFEDKYLRPGGQNEIAKRILANTNKRTAVTMATGAGIGGTIGYTNSKENSDNTPANFETVTKGVLKGAIIGGGLGAGTSVGLTKFVNTDAGLKTLDKVRDVVATSLKSKKPLSA